MSARTPARTILAAALLTALLSTSLVSAQAWIFQGPRPHNNGQVENVGNNNSVSGAVHAILAHPTDANTLYIGSANGGVWKTTNATAASPTWTPLTDTMPSLSIGAMAFDRSAANFPETVLAGIGAFSSYGRYGRLRGGVLRSTNGGASWTSSDGGGTMAGKTISGLGARGATIVASVSYAEPFNCNNIGIYRSTNTGASYTLISASGAVGTGLPYGAVYDLVEDPTSTTRLYASVVFGESCNATDLDGIYRSTDTGATWTKVSSAAIDALITANTSNLELAVGSAGEVYAGVINSGQLAGLFRAAAGGTTWVQLDTPSTNEGGTLIGIHPSPKGPGDGATPAEIAGGQGAVHFSMIADRTNTNLVYVGGDRQPLGSGGVFPNSLGAVDYSGRLFRVNAALAAGSQVSTLTHCSSTLPAGCPAISTTNNSSPHADSRDMAFDANGNLIEVDDGGVYRRSTPSGQGTWSSLMGTLGVTELHDIAWDSRSNILIGGAQDTGTPQQVTTGNVVWNSVSTGDGADVAVDVTTQAALSRSVRYSSFQNLLVFRRATYNNTNGLLSTTFPTLTPIGGSPTMQALFNTPVELNAIDPLRLVFAANNGVYESLDGGSTVRQLSPANKSNAFNGDPVAYGGSRFGAENAEVIYAFFETAATTVYTRTTAGVTLTAGTPLPPLATYVSDIVLDPDDWRTAYVADNSGTVYVTTNTGASWTNITGNLSTLNLGLPLHAIEFVRSPAGDAIYVGGARGVFKMPTATPGVWTEYGTGIPEADVWDLGYDAADDLLVASTLGRGAWTVTDVAGVVCGDSVVEAPEICDAGGESAACDTDCTPTFCGDGWLNSTALELCDDGNMTNGDGCDDDVFLGGSCGAPRCGNGTVEGSEQCDDGNNVEGDGCSATCVNELCGDGIVNDGVLVDLILNGNFESGAFAPWVRSNAGSGTFLIATPGANAPLSGFATQGNAGGGSFYAIADTDGPGAHALAQTFTVPWNATSVVLSFEMFVNDWSGVGPIVHPNGLDFNATPNQHARVDLLAAGSGAFDTGTTVVANLYLNVDPGSSPHTYTPYTFDLTGVAAPGGSYVLRFAEVDNQFYQNLGVDNVHVVALVPEECDDGGTTPGDGCNATCHLEFCGDGIVNDVHDDELIVNGSFETNTLVPWSVTNFGSGDFFVGSNGAAAPISGNPTAVNPAGGSYYAVQDTTGPGTHALRQDFVVPSSAVAVELRFEMFVNDWSGAGPIVSPGGLDHTAGPNQHARVDILAAGSPALDTGAGVVRNVYLGVDPAAPNAYTPYSFDVTGTVAPGTTYALRFAEVDNQNYQNLGVDNVRIIASTFEECDDGNQNNADGCTTSCQYGCQSSAECDDGNPCTDDACTVQFSCLYTPIPDTDGDGSCDAVDNCPHTPNPGNGTARFPEPIRASNTTAFSWSVPRDVQWVRGNLAAVSSYSYIEFVGSGFATSITSGSVPAPGSGFYYLVKPWCPATTWSSGGAGECAVPGSCPAGGRDGNLP